MDRAHWSERIRWLEPKNRGDSEIRHSRSCSVFALWLPSDAMQGEVSRTPGRASAVSWHGPPRFEAAIGPLFELTTAPPQPRAPCSPAVPRNSPKAFDDSR